MSNPSRILITELAVIVTTLVVLALIVFFGSAYGALAHSEIYGDTNIFGFETVLATTAYRWSPFAFALIIIGYVWCRIQRTKHTWVSWCALSLAALITGLVLYGIVRPFASTTFQLGNC
jgi:hypothetical protein